MEKITKKIVIVRYIIMLAVIGGIFSSCSKMDDTFKEFIKDGKIPYTGKAEPVSVHPGRNRLMLAWPTPSDPKATTAKLYWNNRQDSIEVPMDRQADTTRVVFNDWEEGSYVFEVFTFDSKGTSSLKVEVMARVYGDQYEGRLLSKPIDGSTFADDTVRIAWGASPDTSAIGSEIKYEDINGVAKRLFAPSSDLLTTITDFIPQTIQYRTLYKPNSFALDTFYTDYFTHRVFGPPRKFSKAGWTATASSFDSRSGNSYRPASNAIDGNASTDWVNQVAPQVLFPHTITVDMGQIRAQVEGFAFISRISSASRVRTVELLTSVDNITWTTHGEFIVANTASEQFIAIPEPVSARYFKVIAKNAYDNGNNIGLAEVGLYTL